MNIGVDIRPLLEKERSGVGEYTFRLLDAFFDIDKENHYFLFYNSFKKADDLLPEAWRGLPNVHFCGFRWPNKLFNFSLKFFKWPKIDRLVESSVVSRQSSVNLDLFFMPNLNFVALSSGVKKIITIHDLSFERYPSFFSWKRRLWHWFINPRKLIRDCDKVIAVSGNTKRDSVELYGVASEKVEIIYSGVDQASGIKNQESRIKEVKEKYNLPENFILFLGTLEPRKNVEGLIRAFELLKTHYSSLITHHLIIVGPKGWGYKSIVEKIKSSPVCEDIKLINYIRPEEKFAFYKLAKLFVYPSFYEGFGFPPLEAAAAGTPVIVSTASSLPEIMGEAALMVDPYNVNELAKVMYEGLANQELRESLIEKGKRQAEKFSWEKCARDLLSAIHNNG